MKVPKPSIERTKKNSEGKVSIIGPKYIHVNIPSCAKKDNNNPSVRKAKKYPTKAEAYE
jgi:hypothetical protein